MQYVLQPGPDVVQHGPWVNDDGARFQGLRLCGLEELFVGRPGARNGKRPAAFPEKSRGVLANLNGTVGQRNGGIRRGCVVMGKNLTIPLGQPLTEPHSRRAINDAGKRFVGQPQDSD